nr:hypothetical protein [Streptomyces sp. DSM 41633]
MTERARRGLTEQLAAASASKPLALSGSASVVAGQVRRLRAYDDDMDSMLVLVLAVDSAAASATVVAVASPVDQATTRDIVVGRAGTGVP